MAQSKFKGQFVITSNKQNPLQNWKSIDLDSTWKLHVEPSVNCYTILHHNHNGDGDGDNTVSLAGILLGYVINKPQHSNKFILKHQCTRAKFEQFIYRLKGRYVGIFLADTDPEIYLDPVGSMSVVYSQDFKAVASSPKLILGENYKSDFNSSLYKKLKLPESGFWFPGTCTPHQSVKRLLPNHFLTLSNWQQVRHWPESDFSLNNKPDRLVKTISSELSETMNQFVQQQNLYLSLTAGRDSRMLLAASKSIANQVRFFTFTKKIETVDEYMAKKLANDFELDWSKLPIQEASKDQKNGWLTEVGHSVSDGIWKIHSTLEQLDSTHCIVPAMGGEIGRAFYYKEDDRYDSKITASSLLRRLKLPDIPEFNLSVQQWIENLPDVHFFTVLDLAYIELRLGCWGSPQIYGNQKFGNHVYPFSDRRIIKAMLQLPASYKMEQQLTVDLISKTWPELNDYPFNTFKGLHKIKSYIEKAYHLPNYVRRKILTK